MLHKTLVLYIVQSGDTVNKKTSIKFRLGKGGILY